MKKLDIIYEDKELLVVNKPSGILTIRDNKNSINLYEEVSSYVKKQHKSNKVFIVHRLDKDTSGVIVFAKNEKVKRDLQDNWDKSKRIYIALTEGVPNKNKGIIKEYLSVNKANFVYKSNEKIGKYAETHYQVINKYKDIGVLKVDIKTGRKNQIRVGLAGLNSPIVGDKKYGSKINPLKRMGLHAYSLSFKYKNREYNFRAKLPIEFKKYINDEILLYNDLGL